MLNAIVIKHEDPKAAYKLCFNFNRNGLLAKPTHGDKIRFAPPLIIKKNRLDECIEILKKALLFLIKCEAIQPLVHAC